MSLSGSVLRTCRSARPPSIMFGQSFLNRFTPANAGGMAMRVRYLQRGGRTEPWPWPRSASRPLPAASSRSCSSSSSSCCMEPIRSEVSTGTEAILRARWLRRDGVGLRQPSSPPVVALAVTPRLRAMGDRLRALDHSTRSRRTSVTRPSAGQARTPLRRCRFAKLATIVAFALRVGVRNRSILAELGGAIPGTSAVRHPARLGGVGASGGGAGLR